ncbi:MAG: radical SAM protein [Acidobacteria bacterium]|nr:radical SAM protein [Acidobacteriota bacterium]
MKINEIFYSIQGESSFAGLPFAFIRLSGCNLRCSYCDTEYAFHEGAQMSVPEVMKAIEPFPTRLALVTGGEPLLQRSVHELFGTLLEHGYTVLVETGGQVPLADVDPRVHKIMDFKCPSSGMDQRNRYENVSCLTRNDEVKFVVSDRNDFDWACRIICRFDLVPKVSSVLFSPVHGRLPYRDLASWVLDCGMPVRMQIQMHKLIWPGMARGV